MHGNGTLQSLDYNQDSLRSRRVFPCSSSMMSATKVVILFIKILSAQDPGTEVYKCTRGTCNRLTTVLFTRGDDQTTDDFTYPCELAARDQEKAPCARTRDCSAASLHPCFHYKSYGTTVEKFVPAHCKMQPACEHCVSEKYCVKYTVRPFRTSSTPQHYIVCNAYDVKKMCPKCSCHNTTIMNEINSGWKNPAPPTSPSTTIFTSTAETPAKTPTDSNTSARQDISDPSNKTGDKKETKSSSSVIITAVVVCIAALVAVIVGAVQITKMVMKSHDESQRSRRRKDEAALTSGVSKRSTSHMSGRSSLMFAPTPEDSRISRSPSVSGKAEKD